MDQLKKGGVGFYQECAFCVKWKNNQQIMCLFTVPRQL